MPILVDSREPQDMVDLISARVNGQCRYAESQLNSGDYCFLGNGPEGEITVGIERKKIHDMLGSERSGRVTCQIANMIEEYDFCCLIVEGLFRPGETGIIETLSYDGWGPLNMSTAKQREERTRNNDFRYYSELDNYETSLELRRRVMVKETGSKRHTAWRIANLYHYFQKSWEDHSAVEQVKIQSGIITKRASHLRMMAAQLPGIGWGRAGKVEKHFRSITHMVNSSLDNWLEIDGIGKKTAEGVLKVLKEEAR